MTKRVKYNIEELLAIDNYLKLYGHDKSFDNLVVLDGFIAAIVCSKQILMPSQWMKIIWGGSQNQPVWDDELDFVKFTRYTANHFSYVESAIAHETYSPMVNGEGKSKLQKYRPWCQGFIIGSQYWNQSIDDFDDETNEYYGIIALLANKNPNALLKDFQINIDLRSFDISSSLQTALINIHQYFIKRVKNVSQEQLINTTQKKSKKIGRNEPCPCGSGKKHKKCCINK